MTRKEARKAAEVMLAYADGKEVECLNRHESQWRESEKPGFDWEYFEFRIKPEPKYRPFKDAEECWQEMQKHQPFGWIKVKNNDCYLLLTAVQNIGVYTTGKAQFESEFINCTFADGTPFGVKEEEA